MILVHSNIWDSLVIIPLDVMSELCGLLLVCGLIRSLSTGQGRSRVQPCSFLSTVITPLVNLIRSQGFFFFKAKVNLFQHIKFNGILLISYQDCT